MSQTPLLDFLNDNQVAGQPFAIEFQGGIESLEGYADQGMRAHVTSFESFGDGVVKVHVDFSAFDEFNKAIEKPNYFDKNGSPTLTAREAGQYQATDILFMDEGDNLAHFFALLNPQNVLVDEWRQSQTTDSYVTFLENQVAELRAERQVAMEAGSAPRATRGPKP